MYKKDGYFLRAAAIQWIDRALYQPYHDSCHRMVWKKFGYPIFFYTYQTFLNYLKVKIPPEFNKTPPAIGGFLKTMANGNGLKSLALSFLRNVQACVGELINLILTAEDFSPENEAEYQRSIESEHKAELRAQSARRKSKTGNARKIRTDGLCFVTARQHETIRQAPKAKIFQTSATKTQLPFSPFSSALPETKQMEYACFICHDTTWPYIRPVPDLIPAYRLPSPQPDTPSQTPLLLITATPLCDENGTLTVPLRAPMVRDCIPRSSFQPLRTKSTVYMTTILTRGAPGLKFFSAST